MYAILSYIICLSTHFMSLFKYVTCPYQMWHCSWSLGPDGLDCANHINLSLCLHLLNQRPNGYECTSAAQTITGEQRHTCIRQTLADKQVYKYIHEQLWRMINYRRFRAVLHYIKCLIFIPCCTATCFTLKSSPLYTSHIH